MNTLSLEVKKTARIYTLGTLCEQTENIWIVFHGYGMLARYFIKKFEDLDLKTNFIIAPEALSKFYQSGFTGRIGATWMTSEDRENEIKDYTNYIESVFQKLIANQRRNKRLIAFGFSQGVSTLFRWANTSHHKIDKLAAWSGTIPQDVLDNYQLDNSQLYLFYGNQDPFLSEKRIQEYLQQLGKKNITFNINEFEGGHQIIQEKLFILL
ncbi:MAG: dienelactone hydrolase family protein [Chitinophagales bacterium]|nr:dienelactone hydrolase family protein [Chitinophagales bacterium]